MKFIGGREGGGCGEKKEKVTLYIIINMDKIFHYLTWINFRVDLFSRPRALKYFAWINFRESRSFLVFAWIYFRE